MTQPLASTVRTTALEIAALLEVPELIPQFESWLEREIAFWIPLVEPILADLNVNVRREGLTETLAAWFLLNFTAGPIDNLYDKDKDLGYWSEIGLGGTVLLTLNMISEALAFPPVAAITKIFVRAFRDASRGQLMDIRGVKNLDQYEDMITLKSGAIFRAQLEAVGKLGGVTDERQHLLAKLGETIGILIQIQNDIQGIWNVGAANELSDLQKPHLTLPSFLASKSLEHEPNLQKELETLLTEVAGKRDEERILELMSLTPTRTILVKMIQLRIGYAQSILNQLELESSGEIIGWLGTIFLPKKNPS